MALQRRKTQRILFSCLFVQAFNVANAQFHAKYSYCCDIFKCRRIAEACRTNGTTCVETCMDVPGQKFTCEPSDLNALASRDYSCFETFLNKTTPPLSYVCGQRYSPGTVPAPTLDITYAECKEHCSGWAISQGDDPQTWATPLIQYIIPAVIFSMTIPRRRRLAAPDSWFNFELKEVLGVFRALGSLVFAGILVTIDTSVWICIIMATIGPMLVAGLHEAFLDFRVMMNLHHVDARHQYQLLSLKHRIEVENAVVCGNLDLKDNSQNVINGVMQLPSHHAARQESVGSQLPSTHRLDSREFERIRSLLSSLMTSQYSFGQTVGGPVIFYLGSFVFDLATISQRKGSNATAHGLAFGMWWMVIVHCAIVAGCLLGNNNPSTITAIVAQGQDQERAQNGSINGSINHASNFETAEQDQGERQENQDSDRKWFDVLGNVYDTPFQSVTMWSRGSTKHKWIQETGAWKERWFEDHVAIGWMGWSAIALFANLLILIPSMLAAIVSWATPRRGLGCRAITFVVYACSQIVLIAIAIIKSVCKVNGGPSNGYPFLAIFRKETWKKSWVIGVNSCILWFFAFAAGSVAVFVGVGGTLMQILGVYANCKCAIPITNWGNIDNQMCNVASDTIEDRESSDYWSKTGYSAVAFMAFICYIGWWYQRYLRYKFLREVKQLGSLDEAQEMIPRPGNAANA